MAKSPGPAMRRSPLDEDEARAVKAGDRLVLRYSEDPGNFDRFSEYAVVAVIDRPDGFNMPTTQYREDQGLPREQTAVEAYRWREFKGGTWMQQDLVWVPVSRTKIMVARKMAAGEAAPPFWRGFVIQGRTRRECLHFSNFSLPSRPAPKKPKRR